MLILRVMSRWVRPEMGITFFMLGLLQTKRKKKRKNILLLHPIDNINLAILTWACKLFPFTLSTRRIKFFFTLIFILLFFRFSLLWIYDYFKKSISNYNFAKSKSLHVVVWSDWIIIIYLMIFTTTHHHYTITHKHTQLFIHFLYLFNPIR